jgi:hypothetical protein
MVLSKLLPNVKQNNGKLRPRTNPRTNAVDSVSFSNDLSLMACTTLHHLLNTT